MTQSPLVGAATAAGPEHASSAVTRPQLHLTAREGWINDPLGLTWHNGLYHLFFQYVPSQLTWSPRCRWGHAVSTDLLTWTEREVILEPGDGDGGCWSGSVAVDADGQATLFYTSVQLDDLNIGRVRAARPTDETWDRWDKGPVIAEVKPPADTPVFRDPHVSRHGDQWRMLLGAGRPDGTATALSYSSTDLSHWTADGEFASRSGRERQPLWTGTVWECPQLIAFGDRCVLLFSVWEPWVPHYEAYAVGRMRGEEFVPGTWGRLSYGDSYYAAAAFADEGGRPGLIYWLRGIDDLQGRWAGAHSLPHQLRLDDDVLIAEPHPNLAERRKGAVTIGQDQGPNRVALPPLADLEWKPGPDRPARLTLHSADGTPAFYMTAVGGNLQFEIGPRNWTMPFGPTVRIILDGPVIEVFTKDGTFSASAGTIAAHAITVTNGACVIHEL